MTISAVSLVIASAVLLRSITEAMISVDEESSNKAWSAVNACGEIALWNLASTTVTHVAGGGWNYAGGETVAVGDNSCYIRSVIAPDTSTTTSRTVQVNSTVNDFTRKLQIVTAYGNPKVTVTSWELVADF